ncbi:MAG: peptidoglycan-binding protein, partial [Moorea sp. SIO3I7]|nr:peptidoglycan-binding protein [Moorena sp. SIO3I7]
NDQPSSAYLPLIQGAVGSEVEELQQLLQTQGFYSGATDGDFGSRTKSAVIAYQKAKGLYADGIVGSITWSTLNLD